jgi:tetratricopeptide (TPR) repeat protein
MLQKGTLAYWLYKDSVSVRGFYWRAGIKMLQDNLLTGVGVDRYGSFFKYYREVEYPLRYGYDITSSNAHNTIIQIFSTAGFFAGVAYVGLIAYVLFTAIGFIKNTKGEQQLIVISLISIWVGFQAQSIISIDNIGVSVWGWLLSGAILGYIKSTNLKKENIEIKSRKITSNKVQINLFQPVISTLAVLLILVIVIPIYRSETNSYLVKSLGNNLTEQNKGALFNYSKKVIDNKFADPTYKFKAALYMYDAGYQTESISIIEDLEIKDPKNLDFLNGLAYIYVKQGQLQDAIKVRKLIADNDPWNAENYLSLGSLLVQTGDNVLAKVYLSKIASFAPNTEVATKSQEIINSLG